MPAAASQPFREGSLVRLDVGAGAPTLAATVVAFLGRLLVIRPLRAADSRLEDRIGTGATGYLLVDAGGRLQALACRVAMLGGDALAIRLTDAFRLGQHRAWTRVPVRLEAGVTPDGGAAPVSAVTLDVSPGGVRVAWRGGAPAWRRCEVRLTGEQLGGAPVTAQAVPARATPDALALRFTRLSDGDRARLIELLVREAAAHRPPAVVADVAAPTPPSRTEPRSSAGTPAGTSRPAG